MEVHCPNPEVIAAEKTAFAEKQRSMAEQAEQLMMMRLANLGLTGGFVKFYRADDGKIKIDQVASVIPGSHVRDTLPWWISTEPSADRDWIISVEEQRNLVPPVDGRAHAPACGPTDAPR